MAAPSPSQLVWRRRVETMLRVAAPALDLVLFAGDRISRVAERTEDDAAVPAVPLTSPSAPPAVGPGPAD
jgi:hypothetical protein